MACRDSSKRAAGHYRMARIFELSCVTTLVLLAMQGASVITSHKAQACSACTCQQSRIKSCPLNPSDTTLCQQHQSRLRRFSAGKTTAAALGPGHALLFKDQAVVLKNFQESFRRRFRKNVSDPINATRPFRS